MFYAYECKLSDYPEDRGESRKAFKQRRSHQICMFERSMINAETGLGIRRRRVTSQEVVSIMGKDYGGLKNGEVAGMKWGGWIP